MINRFNFVFYTAIALYFGYYLQGIVYPTGSLMSQTFLLLYLLIGIYCAFHTLFLSKANALSCIWGIFVLILSFTFLLSPPIVHGTMNEAIGEISTFMQFKESISFSLTYFIACYVGKNGTISNKQLFYFGIAFFLLSFLKFKYTGITLEQENDGSIGFTNNAAYDVAITLPFLVLIFKRSKLIAGILLVLSITLIMLGAKRGAIVCLITIALFVLIYYLKNTKISLTKYLTVILIICSIGWYVNMSYQSNEYLMHRIEKTSQVGIGGREVAYTMLFDHWNREQDPIAFFFGNGTAQTINIWGNYAHNDWLELLIDNGFMGFIIYLLLFLLTFREIRCTELEHMEKVTCYCAFITWFCRAAFSMGYTSFTNAILLILLGIFLNREEICENEEEYLVTNPIKDCKIEETK